MKRTTNMVGVAIVVALLVGAFAVPAGVAAPAAGEVRFANYAAATSNQWFVKFVGVNGEATAEGYEDWTNAHGVSWDLDASSSGVPQTTPVAVTMDFDLAAVPILKKCDEGAVIKQVNIEMTFPADGRLQPYTRYKLNNAICRYYSIASSVSETQPLVTMLLEFRKMTVTYLAYDELGRRVGFRQHVLDWVATQ